MTRKLPLREIKKARSKIALFRASLELVGTKTFKEVRLEEICEKAEVSKVTFFKFFPQKEDLLVYFMRVWLADRLIELKQQPRRGLDAIRHLLRNIAEGARERPGLMLSLIGFLSEMRMHPKMPALSEAEIHLLYPGKESLVEPEVPNLGDMFFQFLEQAKDDHEIALDLPTEDLVKIMFTIFYGAYLTAHIYNADNVMEYYDLILNVLTLQSKSAGEIKT